MITQMLETELAVPGGREKGREGEKESSYCLIGKLTGKLSICHAPKARSKFVLGDNCLSNFC